MRKSTGIFLMVLIMAITANISWAANTIVYGTRTVSLSAIDSNYDFGADSTLGTLGSKATIMWIKFKPSAANDVICILDGAAAAKPDLLYATSIDGGNLVFYPGIKASPFLVVANCTFSNAANVRLTIGYKMDSDRW